MTDRSGIASTRSSGLRNPELSTRRSFLEGLRVPEFHSEMRGELLQAFLENTNRQGVLYSKMDRALSKSRSRSSLGTAPVDSEMEDYGKGEASGSGSGSGSGEEEAGTDEEEEEEEEPVVPTRKGKERERGWRKGE